MTLGGDGLFRSAGEQLPILAPALRMHPSPERADLATTDPEHARRLLADLAEGPYDLSITVHRLSGERAWGAMWYWMRGLVRRGWVHAEALTAAVETTRYTITDEGRKALARWMPLPLSATSSAAAAIENKK